MSSTKRMPSFGCLGYSIVLFLLFPVVFIGGCVMMNAVIERSTTETVTITVREKLPVIAEGDTYYKIFCDEGTFVIYPSTQRIAMDKLYNQLELGRRYRAKVAGFSFENIDVHRNIISVTPLTD